MITNCVFLGLNAGADIAEGDSIVIIGDNIRSLDRSNPNTLFLGEKVAIGKTLFGEEINVYDVVKRFTELNTQYTL